MNSERGIYLKFILSIITLLVLAGAADQIVGRILRRLFFEQTSGLLYRTTYAIDSTKADILVFGSSRANHHYVPEIFEDSLKASFYNTGRDGNFLLFNYSIFKAVINRYTPRIVIFDINPDELDYSNVEYERLSSLLPYYKKHPEIRSIALLKSPYEKYKLISEIYPFNSDLFTILIGNLEINKNRENDRQGYVPLTGIIGDSVLLKMDASEADLDPNKLNSIQEIIQCCKSNNIRLFFIQSPVYGILNCTLSTKYITEAAEENDVTFWDFSNSSDFLSKPAFFQDQAHLNGNGAIVFSNIVVNRILHPELCASSPEP